MMLEIYDKALRRVLSGMHLPDIYNAITLVKASPYKNKYYHLTLTRLKLRKRVLIGGGW